jgi:hypothetical protein
MRLSLYLLAAAAAAITTVDAMFAPRIQSMQNANPMHLAVFREAVKEAVRTHTKYPERCSMMQRVDAIKRDAVTKFHAKVGGSVEPPLVPHQCTRCKFVFDDYTQAALHSC